MLQAKFSASSRDIIAFNFPRVLRLPAHAGTWVEMIACLVMQPPRVCYKKKNTINNSNKVARDDNEAVSC